MWNGRQAIWHIVKTYIRKRIKKAKKIFLNIFSRQTIQLIKISSNIFFKGGLQKWSHFHSQVLKEKKLKNITLKSEFQKLHIHVNLTMNKWVWWLLPIRWRWNSKNSTPEGEWMLVFWKSRCTNHKSSGPVIPLMCIQGTLRSYIREIFILKKDVEDRRSRFLIIWKGKPAGHFSQWLMRVAEPPLKRPGSYSQNQTKK